MSGVSCLLFVRKFSDTGTYSCGLADYSRTIISHSGFAEQSTTQRYWTTKAISKSRKKIWWQGRQKYNNRIKSRNQKPIDCIFLSKPTVFVWTVAGHMRFYSLYRIRWHLRPGSSWNAGPFYNSTKKISVRFAMSAVTHFGLSAHWSRSGISESVLLIRSHLLSISRNFQTGSRYDQCNQFLLPHVYISL